MSGRLEGFQKASLTTESEGAPVSVIPPSIIKPLADVSDPAANSTDTAATGRVHSGRDRVEDFVGAQVQECDPNQMLDVGDFQEVIEECSSKVLKVMDREKRSEMDEEDQAFIVRRVHKMVAACFEQYEAQRAKPTRYHRAERVVCMIGGARRWASGLIASVNEDDPETNGRTKLPYVVKIDAKFGEKSRLVSVSKDNHNICRAEVCFGSRAGALWFTLFCVPLNSLKGERRFALGERVVCAVEDESDDYSTWASGKVVDVDYSIEADAAELLPDCDWSGNKAKVPYRVELDSGCHVLVHRDEHWLVRDATLQAAGPRQVADGAGAASCLTRLERRHKGDYTFEAVDHHTRRVRPCEVPSDGEEVHSDDCECGGPRCQ